MHIQNTLKFHKEELVDFFEENKYDFSCENLVCYKSSKKNFINLTNITETEFTLEEIFNSTKIFAKINEYVEDIRKKYINSNIIVTFDIHSDQLLINYLIHKILEGKNVNIEEIFAFLSKTIDRIKKLTNHVNPIVTRKDAINPNLTFFPVCLREKQNSSVLGSFINSIVVLEESNIRRLCDSLQEIEKQTVNYFNSILIQFHNNYNYEVENKFIKLYNSELIYTYCRTEGILMKKKMANLSDKEKIVLNMNLDDVEINEDMDFVTGEQKNFENIDSKNQDFEMVEI